MVELRVGRPWDDMTPPEQPASGWVGYATAVVAQRLTGDDRDSELVLRSHLDGDCRPGIEGS
jgi:hypothetical protein